MEQIVLNDLDIIFYSIKQHTKLFQVFLFGSRANGHPTQESDIDLCIVADAVKSRTETLRSIRQDLFAKVESPLDLLLYSPEEFQSRSSVPNSFEWTISHNGIRVYG
jgi:predicted nucleotidyltransferase